MAVERTGDEAKLAFLREVGVDQIRHIRVSLYEHLVATRDVLAGWGASQILCDAALFHAVYGTEQIDRRLSRRHSDHRRRTRALVCLAPELLPGARSALRREDRPWRRLRQLWKRRRDTYGSRPPP